MSALLFVRSCAAACAERGGLPSHQTVNDEAATAGQQHKLALSAQCERRRKVKLLLSIKKLQAGSSDIITQALRAQKALLIAFTDVHLSDATALLILVCPRLFVPITVPF